MSAILNAFGEYRASYAQLNALPDEASDALCEPYHARQDAASEICRRTPATTQAEAAAKLRIALQGIDVDGVDALIILNLHHLLPDELRPARQLTAGDWFEDMIWDTILELEAQDDRSAWERAREAYVDALAAERAADATRNGALADACTEKRCEAEDVLMAISSPDAAAFALKCRIAHGDGRETDCWNEMLDAEAKRFAGPEGA
jgi:hypothetical protein